jgi:hypothetical protein
VRRLGLPSYGKGSRFQSDLWLVVFAWYLETGGQSLMLAKFGVAAKNVGGNPMKVVSFFTIITVGSSI